MKRRFVIFGLGAMALALPTDALAQTAQDHIVRQLRDQGYSSIRAQRTLLGRVRITARKGRQTREIVFNPSNGSILRDYWDNGDGQIQNDDRSSGGSRSGSSRDDRDDGDSRDDDDDRDDSDDRDDRDDRDDSDDRDDRDDNSGSGSSGSGRDDDDDDDDDNSGSGGGGDDDDDDDD